jgi:hypothetical protein
MSSTVTATVTGAVSAAYRPRGERRPSTNSLGRGLAGQNPGVVVPAEGDMRRLLPSGLLLPSSVADRIRVESR